jgi:hypothetical protein
LGANAGGDTKLEIVEASGRVIRAYSSRDTSMAPADLGNTPSYWIRPTKVLSAAPGFHRFVWDLHYAAPAGTSSQSGQYPISATPHDTPRGPRGPWALPGQYTVRLTAGGKTYEKPLVVRMDPRVKTPAAVIAQEHALAVALFDDIARDSAIVAQVRGLQTQLRAVRDRANNATLTETINTYDEKLNALAGQGGGGGRRGGGGGRGRGGAGAQPSFSSINGELLSMLALLEGADAEPTTQALAAVRGTQRDFDALVARWNVLRTTDLNALNAKLRQAGQQAVSVSP